MAAGEAKTTGAALIDVGWGRLIFAHTFPDPQSVADVLLQEKAERRDIAFYVTDPQLVLNIAPQDLFLDPSDTYRLDLEQWKPVDESDGQTRITGVETRDDIDEMNRIYLSQGMVPVDPEVVWQARDSDRFQYVLARPLDSDAIVGVALAIDHSRCFDDLLNSSSLWALAVDPQNKYPRVGSSLVESIANLFAGRGRSVLDLSVLHENEAAISLYEALGFKRVPVLAIKRRNQINQPLFVPQHFQEGFNPYATIIINEALRRSISVEPLDPERGYFRLTLGNRRITCCESLSDLTTAIAMSRCADKQLTRDLLHQAELKTPEQLVYTDFDHALEFLHQHARLVVKPVDGEQGQGVYVGVSNPEELLKAIDGAGRHCQRILLEEYCSGLDLRVIVINFEVVAAAVRKPPEIIGDGQHSIRRLIERLSRRRSAATDGESYIPLDEETDRCVQSTGNQLDDVLAEGEIMKVRRTANLHTGGTIHDVTSQMSDTLLQAATEAARALEVPVVGLDFLVPSVEGNEYVIIEANERPGLANHEPQPTAERFVDLLFPHLPKPTEATE